MRLTFFLPDGIALLNRHVFNRGFHTIQFLNMVNRPIRFRHILTAFDLVFLSLNKLSQCMCHAYYESGLWGMIWMMTVYLQVAVATPQEVYRTLPAPRRLIIVQHNVARAILFNIYFGWVGTWVIHPHLLFWLSSANTLSGVSSARIRLAPALWCAKAHIIIDLR